MILLCIFYYKPPVIHFYVRLFVLNIVSVIYFFTNVILRSAATKNLSLILHFLKILRFAQDDKNDFINVVYYNYSSFFFFGLFSSESISAPTTEPIRSASRYMNGFPIVAITKIPP